MIDPSALDRWITHPAYRSRQETCYCWTPGCANEDGAVVRIITEYGREEADPDRCRRCGGEWHEREREET